MLKIALGGLACLALAAPLAAAAPAMKAEQSIAQSRIILVRECPKGTSYGFCTNQRTGRRYRGCCRNAG
jgi:hypothetical protein